MAIPARIDNSISKTAFLTHVQKRCDQVRGTDAEEQFESFRERVLDTAGATVAQMLQVTNNAGKIAHQRTVQTMIKGGLVAGLGAAIAWPAMSPWLSATRAAKPCSCATQPICPW